MNSLNYQNMLEDYLISLLDHYPQVSFIYQKDNVVIHVGATSRAWFEEQNIAVLRWPEKSSGQFRYARCIRSVVHRDSCKSHIEF